VVTPAVHPPHQHNLFAGVRGAKIAAQMGAFKTA
jgi:hypothetical protein